MIDGLGPEAVAALRAAADDAPLAAHARDIAHRYELAPEPGVADMVWLATEYAHADLTNHGVGAARYTATDILSAVGVDLDTAASTGSPAAGIRTRMRSPTRCAVSSGLRSRCSS